MNRTTPRTSPRFRTAAASSGAATSSPTTAVVSPRKRAIVPTPPLMRTAERFKRTSEKIKRISGSTSSSTSSDKPVAAKLKRKDDALYYMNLEIISYYELLNVTRNATKADITSKVNNLQLTYKKSRSSTATTAAENTNEKIHSTLGNALQVLSVVQNRRIYDQYVNEKDKITNYFNDNIVPLRKTVNEIFSGALRLQNDAKDFYEIDIAQLLKTNIEKIIKQNIKNIHYKTTLTNRLLLEWPIDESTIYNNAGIDEDYLQKYFENDGIIAVIMCSSRPGCAVIELMMQKNIKTIIDREHDRKTFSSVRDFTEAEFGLDHTNYKPQLDKVDVLLNDIEELEQTFRNDLQYLEDVDADDNFNLENIERQLNFNSALIKMESSGEELDDEDEYMYTDDDVE
ncbi:J-domain binding protein [Alphabaculovirus altersperidaniae]|uniref:J-domain binding protein n=1 Tax=Spodoptera eridania nucleopolyhedrovirus TaxID=2315721 RepID=A0ABX6TSE5_9ABAC|nr:J-domain binding protein [Spodoptera eridania nucleopolyhedrovirus]QNV47902.1 J-domain binding protein [Spodoptera eridania nucleopolyhedrovirus]